MFVRLPLSRPLPRFLCVAAISVASIGCKTTPPPTSFDTAEQIEAHVYETQMLHRRARVEFKGGAAIPFDTDMNVGGSAAIKGSLEAYKNLFFGVEYGFSHHSIDQTIADFQDEFNADPVEGERLAANADAEQWLESFDRHNLLLTFDYEIPLGDAWGSFTPIVRAGLGVGVAVVIPDEVATSALAADIDARIYTTFVARPNAAIEFPVHDKVRFFLEAALDLLPDGNLTIDGKLVGRRTRVEDKVNFSAALIQGGLTVTW